MKTIQQMICQIGFLARCGTCAFDRHGWRCERKSDSDDQ